MLSVPKIPARYETSLCALGGLALAVAFGLTIRVAAQVSDRKNEEKKAFCATAFDQAVKDGQITPTQKKEGVIAVNYSANRCELTVQAIGADGKKYPRASFFERLP